MRKSCFLTILWFMSFCAAQAGPLAEKPLLGWNSFDSYGVYFSETEAYPTIDAMAEMLKPHGYTYFVIDNGWFGEYTLRPGTRYAAERHASDVNINAYGILQPSKTYFPGGIKPIADYAHAKGLKFGIHLMRGIPRKAVEQNTPIKGTLYHAADIADRENVCSWCHYNYGIDMAKPGAQAFYNSLVNQLAEWGVDFIKADDIVPYPEEVKALAAAIAQCGRPMVLSLSPGDQVCKADLPLLRLGNMLRVTADIWDDEAGITHCFSAWKRWQGESRPGFWIDFDMIPFGMLQLMSPPPDNSAEGTPRFAALAGKGYTRRAGLSSDQMLTFITLRAMTASPLMMGGALSGLDDFSLRLLTHPDMLTCNQNGVMGEILPDSNGLIIAKTPEKGSKNGWIGVFNRTGKAISPQLTPGDFRLPQEVRFRNIWNPEQTFTPGEAIAIPSKGVLFLRYTVAESSDFS